MKTYLIRLLVVLSVLMFGTVAAPAQDVNTAKARISERLPKLDALKTQGVIGENNHGLVELRGGNPDAGDVVAAENSDRNAIYAAVAKQTGATADAVGKARAKVIAANSAAGVWLQNEKGEWSKK